MAGQPSKLGKKLLTSLGGKRKGVMRCMGKQLRATEKQLDGKRNDVMRSMGKQLGAIGKQLDGQINDVMRSEMRGKAWLATAKGCSSQSNVEPFVVHMKQKGKPCHIVDNI